MSEGSATNTASMARARRNGRVYTGEVAHRRSTWELDTKECLDVKKVMIEDAETKPETKC